MIYTIVIFFTVVVSGFIFQWRRYKKSVSETEAPFELTELVQKTPTPTPTVEKKKRVRKPKANQ